MTVEANIISVNVNAEVNSALVTVNVQIGNGAEVTTEAVHEALGISEEGSANKILNEQGYFVDHDHSGQSINPDNVVIDKAYTDSEAAALAVGAIFYNSDQLCWMLKTSGVTYLNMGEELPMICKNGDSATHLEGQAVYITSGTGKLPVLQLANSTIGKCSALATQDVVNTGNGRGYYCFFGQVRTFPYANVIKSTDSEATWVEGAKLYLCSENGRYSTVKEAAPAKAMEVATITDRSGANISVIFNPIPVFAVEDLSNVDGEATEVESGNSLFLKVGTLWKYITESNFLTWIKNYLQPKTLYFENKTVAVGDWVADTTYADYGYKAVISCAGVTSTMLSEVTFAPTEADSGNYAAVCLSGTGTVTIYAKSVPSGTITIPTIKAETV